MPSFWTGSAKSRKEGSGFVRASPARARVPTRPPPAESFACFAFSFYRNLSQKRDASRMQRQHQVLLPDTNHVNNMLLAENQFSARLKHSACRSEEHTSELQSLRH